MPIIVGTLLVVIAGLPLLYFLALRLNPIHLRNPKVESIATYLDLRKGPTPAQRHQRDDAERGGPRSRWRRSRQAATGVGG